LIREKRKARRNWQKSRDPERKSIFNKKLKRLIHELKNQGIFNYLQKLSTGKDSSYSLWKATKRITRPIVNAPPIRKLDGTWARSNQKKADLHVDHLESVFQPHDGVSSIANMVVGVGMLPPFHYLSVRNRKRNQSPEP